MLKRPELPGGFRGRFLKATFGVRVAACGLSSDWLVVRYQGEVSGILIINMVPTSLGSSACGQHAVTILYLGGGWGGVLLSAEQLKDMSDCYVYHLRRNSRLFYH